MYPNTVVYNESLSFARFVFHPLSQPAYRASLSLWNLYFRNILFLFSRLFSPSFMAAMELTLQMERLAKQPVIKNILQMLINRTFR